MLIYVCFWLKTTYIFLGRFTFWENIILFYWTEKVSIPSWSAWYSCGLITGVGHPYGACSVTGLGISHHVSTGNQPLQDTHSQPLGDGQNLMLENPYQAPESMSFIDITKLFMNLEVNAYSLGIFIYGYKDCIFISHVPEVLIQSSSASCRPGRCCLCLPGTVWLFFIYLPLDTLLWMIESAMDQMFVSPPKFICWSLNVVLRRAAFGGWLGFDDVIRVEHSWMGSVFS